MLILSMIERPVPTYLLQYPELVLSCALGGIADLLRSFICEVHPLKVIGNKKLQHEGCSKVSYKKAFEERGHFSVRLVES